MKRFTTLYIFLRRKFCNNGNKICASPYRTIYLYIIAFVHGRMCYFLIACSEKDLGESAILANLYEIDRIKGTHYWIIYLTDFVHSLDPLNLMHFVMRRIENKIFVRMSY